MSSSFTVSAETALPDNIDSIDVSPVHTVLSTPTIGPFPNHKTILVGMGCFWGAERLFWQLQGIFSTQVGYAGGFTKNPTYRQVCSQQTGHAEVVRVVFPEDKFDTILTVFWENHNPTQGMRQGNDRGTQYRSAIYCEDTAQLDRAILSKQHYASDLEKSGFSPITTEVRIENTFYYAEDYHQQYLAKNPSGYCGIRGTGIACAIPQR